MFLSLVLFDVPVPPVDKVCKTLIVEESLGVARGVSLKAVTTESLLELDDNDSKTSLCDSGDI